MQISTVPSRTAGTNTLLCGSAAVEAFKLPSFNTTCRFFSNLPSRFSTPPPQVILVLLFHKMKYECGVLRWMEIDSRAKLESTYKFLCPSDGVTLARLPATSSRFHNVQNRVSLHRWGAKTSTDAFAFFFASLRLHMLARPSLIRYPRSSRWSL